MPDPIESGHHRIAPAFNFRVTLRRAGGPAAPRADDPPELTGQRLAQTNLVGSAGMVSMEDAAVCNMIRRATGGSGDAASVMYMGGKDLTSGGSTKLSERGLRNFWHIYRTDMGY